MDNRSMVWGIVVLVGLLVVVAWGGGWIGGKEPPTAPAPATEQPESETAPAN